MIENKTSYFKAKDIYIYPSSNATDGGATNSEENLVSLVSRIATNNFVISDGNPTYDGDSPLAFKISGTDLLVNDGECCINGYLVRVSNSPVFDLTKIIDFTNLSLSGEQYTVYLQLIFDGAGHVRGDGENINTHQMECWGAVIGVYLLGDEEIDKRPGINLGGFKVIKGEGASSLSISNITYNENKYSFIDSSVIKSPGGVELDKWVKSQLLTLSVLSYWLDPSRAAEGVTPDSYIKIEGNRVLVKTPSLPEFDLLSRLQFATKGGTTPAGTKGSQTSTNNGNTSPPSDGSAIPFYICRADHDHDSRYLLVSTTGYEDLQTIGSNVKFLESLQVVKVLTAGAAIIEGDARVNNDLRVNNNADISGILKVLKGLNINNLLNVDSSGNLRTSGTISGSKVYNAVWNDYAELYKKDDPNELIEPGTVIAKIKGKNTYAPSDEHSGRLVVGVCSDSYGHLLGGDKDKSLEENLKTYVPVALAGRVYVKVVKCAQIDEGDLLTVSALPGRATAVPARWNSKGFIIGKALESSDGTKDKILMQVMLG